MDDIILPEFDKNKHIGSHQALVFDSNVCYDINLGQYFLEKIGLKIDHDLCKMEWMGNMVSINFAVDIKDTNYEKVNTNQVAANQKHLTKKLRDDLARVFCKYDKLFDSTLGIYPKRKVHFEINPNARHIHAQPYMVAKTHEEAFKKELAHLVEIGILESCGATEWALPTFIVQKKDGRVQWISDFREMNKVIWRRVYPLPWIQEILTKRSHKKFFSKLNISMQYYAFEMDKKSAELCTIATPFGKYEYQQSQWESSVLPILLKKSWTRSSMIWKTPRCTLTT